jgi:galactokinase
MSAETDLHREFQTVFSRAPAVQAIAPGRVEFIGNHTDYNGGAVLGAAIDRHVRIAAAANDDGRIRLFTQGAPVPVELTAAGAGRRLGGRDSWANYPLAVWQTLADFALTRTPGFDLMVGSDLPRGAGLSSSAALELAVALGLLKLAGHDNVAAAELAKIGRHAENRYVGVPCGILDQGTIAHARRGHLVRIDCRGPVFSLVPFPGDAALWVFNTREKHSLVDGLYATRHRECQEAARALGADELCQLTPAQLQPRLGALAPELARRARHVVGEHDRVRLTGEALALGDLAETGRLLLASHRSSQRDFENSTPALDALVDALEKTPGVHGARLTGGGFGGAVMALTSSRFSRESALSVAEQHARRFGSSPDVLELHVADGARLVNIT